MSVCIWCSGNAGENSALCPLCKERERVALEVFEGVIAPTVEAGEENGETDE